MKFTREIGVADIIATLGFLGSVYGLLDRSGRLPPWATMPSSASPVWDILFLLIFAAVFVVSRRLWRLERRWESVNQEQAKILADLRADHDRATVAQCVTEYDRLSRQLHAEFDKLKTEVGRKGDLALAAIRGFHDSYDGWIEDVRRRVSALDGKP